MLAATGFQTVGRLWRTAKLSHWYSCTLQVRSSSPSTMNWRKQMDHSAGGLCIPCFVFRAQRYSSNTAYTGKSSRRNIARHPVCWRVSSARCITEHVPKQWSSSQNTASTGAIRDWTRLAMDTVHTSRATSATRHRTSTLLPVHRSRYSNGRQTSRLTKRSEFKYIFRAKVLVGRVCLGKSDMRHLPTASGDAAPDCAVDNESAPHKFIIFKDVQAYPEYLLEYIKS